MTSEIAQNHGLIADEGEPTRRVQKLADFQPKYAHKKYTALAQAMLISERKHEGLWVQPRLSDYDLCRALSTLLESTDWTINDSIDALSDKFQAQLQEDRVAGLPDCFFPLHGHDSRDEQAEAAAPSLRHLKEIRFISEIGHFDEERLQIAAEACGKLCFKHNLELPKGLDDTMLPDLLAKLASMEEGHRRSARR
ncbi:Glycoside hydrolase, clan GH-D [Cordyceps javanica]|uniref:Glycoside hydrolase, clan GH-D n=1 Tax=Cordyceps javanica TaxID=43265 RepID=A0A545VIK3_9HYPO|nr:Glycoside hydrolase, clan GH-D [Cordyceps javanica]TQW01561.1 Glycoside hydrolase, clan GH-D [Cordyceps javanica]